MAVCGCRHREAALGIDPHVVDVEYNDGKVIIKTVVLDNIGDSILNILNISPSCPCTVPKLGKWSLNPGERTEMTLTVTSPDVGDQDVEVVITSDSPQTPVDNIKLHLKGPPLVFPCIWKQPPVTMIGVSGLGDVTATQVEFSTLEATGSEQWISGLIADKDEMVDVSCNMIRVDNGSPFGKDCVVRTYSFEVVIRPREFQRATVQLRMMAGTGDSQSAVGKCSLICDPAPVIRTLPASLNFTRGNKPTSEKVLVLASEDEEMFDVDLTGEHPFCSVSLDGEHNGQGKSIITLKIAVEWEKVPMSETGNFRLSLTTSHPKCREVIVPLHLGTAPESVNSDRRTNTNH